MLLTIQIPMYLESHNCAASLRNNSYSKNRVVRKGVDFLIDSRNELKMGFF